MGALCFGIFKLEFNGILITEKSGRAPPTIQPLEKNKVLWLLTATLPFIAALTGVVRPGIYDHLVAKTIMPGVFAQDLMTLAGSAVILILLFRRREADSMQYIMILGFMGYLFYAYGIYVIERVYTILYFLYMAIFGLSFYSIYILDLCFIMPAFIIVAVMTLKKRGLGFLLTPALYIMGFTLLFPLAQGEFIKPFLYDFLMDIAGLGYWCSTGV